MRLNTAPRSVHVTFEGAPAIQPRNPIDQLRRAVSACLLWENQFYEDGVAIGDRIAALVAQCDPADVAALAVEARTSMKLRHAPLWLVSSLALAGKGPKAEDYAAVINRADEMGELISQFWKDGRRPLPSAMKRGLAQAFGKFDAYQLGKYNRKVAIKLRDVLRLVHPKPANDEQAAMWKAVIADTLPSPDTWEVALSGGADKRETFTRLLADGKLGYLALLRNLRGMADAGVDSALVREAILARKGAHNVLPFRYVAAARACPQFEPALDEALCGAIEGLPILPGKTAVLVDVSGSMDVPLSARSDLKRIDAAAALASIIHGDVRVFTFSHQVVEVPPRRGMAGVDAVIRSQPHGGTYLGAALQAINEQIPHDRLIVITDEQSHDAVGGPKGRGYMINVASYQNGVGYGDWTRINGFSENVLRFIGEHER
jgi:60 kDa SS-A/Ro ribonucleoprotein